MVLIRRPENQYLDNLDQPHLFLFFNISTEIHEYALRDINVGEELVESFEDYDAPPKWLSDFARSQNISLLFSGFNNFTK